MDSSLQYSIDLEEQQLSEEESRLEEEARIVESSLSGLKDIGLLLGLARVKLSLCLLLMRRMARVAGRQDQGGARAKISEKALAALRIVEGLLSENVSEDQKGVVQADPLYREVIERLQEFLLAGGGEFLEGRQLDEKRRRALSRSVSAAIRKYLGEDDLYPPLDPEKYPPLVRKVLLTLFPVLLREKPEKPPYGIGEDEEEVVYSSRNLRLPLSQAIFYLENELIPELEKKLAAGPGDTGLQREIQGYRQRLEDYRKMRFFPRSTPILLEKGFNTEGMTFYSADGEMLVPLPLPVSFRSGTNLDRKMELVRMEVVKRIAGRGVSSSLDREYRRLRSLESGIRGSSRAASMKIDSAWGYRVLRQEFPFLGRLADKGGFKELVSIVRSGSLRSSERHLAALIEKDQSAPTLLSPSLAPSPPAGSDGSAPSS